MVFSYTETSLITIDDPVVPPPGLVYSNSPRHAEGEDGHAYFIKGGNKETIFAELAGCLLADAIGLPVPAVALCTFEGEQFAGSRDLRGVRDVSNWLRVRDKIENLTDLLSVIVVDTWLANRDRNWNNLIGESAGGDRLRLFLIDFEKSVALRPLPLLSTADVADRDLWPSGELGTLIRSWNYLHPPMEPLRRISRLDRNECSALLAPIAEGVAIDWFDSTLEALTRRAAQIEVLVEGVWSSR